MKDILKYLINHCDFLYNDYEFKFIDSYVVKDSSGQGLVVLENEILQFKFTNDKGQLFLDVKSKYGASENDWFSFDLIRQIINPNDIDFAIMNKENANWLERNFKELDIIFSQTKFKETITALKKMESARADRMFGSIK